MSVFRKEIWHYQLRAALLYWGVIPAAVILPGLALDWWLGLAVLPGGAWMFGLGGLLLSAGLALITKATRDLERLGGGTPNPLRPSQQLVTSGSYALCRHPMFLGYEIAALGVILLLGSRATLLFCYPVFLIAVRLFLIKEERILAARFRRSYPAYRQQVPLLLPKLFFREE